VPRRIKEVKVKVIEVAMGPVHTLCLTEESVQIRRDFQKREKSDRKKTAKDLFLDSSTTALQNGTCTYQCT
jgi:hypothetical protein